MPTDVDEIAYTLINLDIQQQQKHMCIHTKIKAQENAGGFIKIMKSYIYEIHTYTHTQTVYKYGNDY